METQQIQKVGLLCIEDGKLLVVYKRNIGVYITPGGKMEPSETEEKCLKREIHEEIGCGVNNFKYFGIFESDSLQQKCYLGKLDGKITLNPQDTITGYQWINRNYDRQSIPLGPMLEHQIIPELVKKGLM